ncbi:hypothetical protein AB7378_15050 [Providencia rettgeri]
MEAQKTHYRKAFDSPYLSSADIVDRVDLTIARVVLEGDKTKKTKDLFNTAYFAEKELRPGEVLKPMILNATNSKMLRRLTGSPFIEDWCNQRVTVYVDTNVKFGREVMEGLRISPNAPRALVQELTPNMEKAWNNAKEAYKRDGNLNAVTARLSISPENEQKLISECNDEANIS